jgi:hypothetical protein
MLKSLMIAGAVACLMLPAAASAAPGGTTTQLSAQQHKKKAVKKTVTRSGPRGGHATTRTVKTRNTTVRRTTVTGPKGNTRSRTTVKTTRPGPRPGVKTTTVVRPGARPGAVTAARIRGPWTGASRRYTWRGRNYTAWRRGPYRVRYGNGWRTFVAISALSAIAIAGTPYYPYAYISAPQDTCTGFTEDGCQLDWAQVPTVDGGPAYQCVAYCPWQGD